MTATEYEPIRDASLPCKEGDPEDYFSAADNDGQLRRSMARTLFRTACPVRVACQEFAMRVEGGVSVKYRHGLYGGLTPTERVRLAKERAEAAKRALAAEAQEQEVRGD